MMGAKPAMKSSNSLSPLAKPTSRQLLARILDEPELVAAVQNLAPAVLGQLITHIGLEDCSELVSLATTEQLRQIFDDDLWSSERPGKDETFDAERFTLWLEVMLESGEDFTAAKLVELPEDLVTLALHRHILVLNIDELAVGMANRQGGVDLLEKALDSCLYHEFEEYRVISRRHNGWDAILSVLSALDGKHFDFLQRILERCCRLSTEFIDDNGGLYKVLSQEDTLDADVAAEREERRARVGYIAPSGAVSFLRLARMTDLLAWNSLTRDPITRAYFRELRPAPISATRPAAARADADTAAATSPTKGPETKLLQVLKEAQVLKETSPQMLLSGSADAKSATSHTPLHDALRELWLRDPRVHEERVSELAFLTNVLIAGCSFAGRSFRPLHAALAVMAVCNLGFEHVQVQDSGLLAKKGADLLFRVGWHLLYDKVSLATIRALQAALTAAAKDHPDRAQALKIDKLRSTLGSAVSTGKFSSARRALGTLDFLFDNPSLVALQALLDECPTLAGALRGGQEPAELQPEGAPRFIARTEELLSVQRFLLTPHT
jgi:hypothetical protein